MIALDQALQQLLGDVIVVANPASVGLDQALGKVLWQDVYADIAVPGEDNSAVDGYALNSSSCKPTGETLLPLSQRIIAGDAPSALTPGTAARIFTGAPVPEGANTVLMEENVQRDGSNLRLPAPALPGSNIRPRGQDIAPGQQVLSQGHRLRPQDLGLLASVGLNQILANQPPRVAIVSTGNELVEPGQPLLPGQIYNSNRYTLLGLLQSLRVEVIDKGVISDSPQHTEAVLEEAAQQADLVISSGGVSVGEEDYVKQAIAKLGRLDLWKLAIKPGKPLAYGRIGNTPFFGLPGNPAAVFVTFCLVARPYLLAMQGCKDLWPQPLRARAEFTLSKPGKRQEYLRARLDLQANEPRINLYPNQSSGVLSSVSWATGLAVVPPQTQVNPGDWLDFLPFGELLC